jgi:predicted esterase
MYPQGTALRDLLRDANHEVDFVPFDGGHEIPPIAVQRMAELVAHVAAT